MRFFVVLADGQKFGPADVPTLNKWIVEGRLTPDTVLEEELSGARQPAKNMPSLDFGGGPPAPSAPAPKPLTPNPFDPLSQVEQAPAARTDTAVKDDRYSRPPQPATNYPRPGISMNQGNLPDDVKRRFNWGAFYFSWVWGLNHGASWTLWMLLLSFIPCAGLIFAVYIGQKGNQAAWDSGRFSTVEEMLACQRIWGYWALGFFLVTVAVYGIIIAVNPLGQ